MGVDIAVDTAKSLNVDEWEKKIMIPDELDKLLTPVIRSIPELRKRWEEQKAQQSNQNMKESKSVVEIPPDCFFIEIPRKAYCWMAEKIPGGVRFLRRVYPGVPQKLS